MEKALLQVKVPASAGELVEGYLEGTNFLSSYFVNLYSQVTLQKGQQEESLPEKTRQLIELLRVKYPGIQIPKIQIQSKIPQAKGMASSTADLVAVLAGIMEWNQFSISAQEQLDLCCQIEPSNGQMFEELALIDFINGQLIEVNENFMPQSILILLPESQMDTVEFYQEPKATKVFYKYIQKDYLKAVRHQSLEGLAEVAYQSAIMNQMDRGMIPYFNEMNGLRGLIGVQGLNIAHSGSLVALWYQDEMISADELSYYVRQFDQGNYYSKHLICRQVKGGPLFEWRRLSD